MIAFEPQSSLVPLLRRNMDLNKWDMKVVEGLFDLSMLEWNFYFMKMDGEGCETQLLIVNSIPPCAIEVHDRVVVDGLKERFGMNVLPQKENRILQNFVQGSNSGGGGSEGISRNA